MASINLNFSNTCPSVAIKNQQQQASHFKLSKTAANNQTQDASYKLSKITTLFFDLDNTLTPTRSGDSKACRKVSVHFLYFLFCGNFPFMCRVCVFFVSFFELCF